MLIAGLNYNSNLGTGVCVSDGEHGAGRPCITAIAICCGLQRGCDHARSMPSPAREASFEFVLRNESSVDRRDIEIRCLERRAACGSVAARSSSSTIE